MNGKDEMAVVVRTGAGSVRGRVEAGVAAFRGVPFAAPPVGDNRFQAPRLAPAWTGIRDADQFGPAPRKHRWVSTFPLAQARDATTLMIG